MEGMTSVYAHTIHGVPAVIAQMRLYTVGSGETVGNVAIEYVVPDETGRPRRIGTAPFLESAPDGSKAEGKKKTASESEMASAEKETMLDTVFLPLWALERETWAERAKGLMEGTPKGTSKATPKGMAKGTQKGTPKGTMKVGRGSGDDKEAAAATRDGKKWWDGVEFLT
jgi:hypothetical protein